MSFFNPEIPLKQKEKSRHPWQNRIKDVFSHTYKYCHNSAKNPVYPPEKETFPKEGRVRFTVIGNRVTKEFIYCLYLVKGLYKYRQKQFESPIIHGVTSVEWPKVWNDLKIQYGVAAFCLRSQVAILINNQFLGGENELKELIGTKFVYEVRVNYYKEGIQQFANFVKQSGRPCAYLHISVNDAPIGVLIFMLYSDIVPYTCENFLRLCEARNGGYGGTPIHRIVKDCWIQCGGFGLKNKRTLGCENFIVPHDRRGVLCMANDGRDVDCSTQFFILLQPAPWMKYKYVAFGQLIEGEKTLQRIESVSTWYESPTVAIKIDQAGVFNMECHRIPINKKTNEYIQGHIDDLFAVGELFYEALLDKVFLEAELRYIKRLEAEEVIEEQAKLHDPQSIHQTKRFLSKKEDIDKHLATAEAHNRAMSVSDKNAENNEYDVDVYDYEFEEYSYKHATVAPTPSIVVKPEKAFYIPLTDVPYPGEVDSQFDLSKLLKGDYCLESDLERSQTKKKKHGPIHLHVPNSLLDALYDCLESEDVEDVASLDSQDEELVKEYLLENVDKVSFGGPTIKKMAQFAKKFEVFEDVGGEKKDLITDDELRLVRIAVKESKAEREKKVSYSIPAAKSTPAAKIKRRQTGFARPEDLASIEKFARRSPESSDDDNDDAPRNVRIMSAPVTEPPTTRLRPSMYTREGAGAGSTMVRQSVLTRLYDDVMGDSDDSDLPTLKDYKSYAETQQNPFTLLTASRVFALRSDNFSREKYHRGPSLVIQGSVNAILNLQHGKLLARKISSDYVKTIDQMENKTQNSIRSIDFAKRRPSLSVNEYQRQNQEYQEKLKALSMKSVTASERAVLIECECDLVQPKDLRKFS